jgi:hypothetical protein
VLTLPEGEARSAALRLARYLTIDTATAALLFAKRFDLFMVSSLELEGKSTDIERRQAMQLVRQCVVVAPMAVSTSVAASLVAVATSSDLFRELALETLCELAISNVQLVAAVDGLNVRHLRHLRHLRNSAAPPSLLSDSLDPNFLRSDLTGSLAHLLFSHLAGWHVPVSCSLV